MTVLELVFLGALQLTSYRPVPAQTDSTPFITSTGERVHKHGAAVSRDLLCPLSYGRNKNHTIGSSRRCDPSRLHYDDWIFIDGYGLKVVNDVMHERHKQAVDMLVFTYKEEKGVGLRQEVAVWKIE